MSGIIVADASPLHYLILIDCAETLPRLFDRILIPPVVRDELPQGSAPAKVNFLYHPIFLMQRWRETGIGTRLNFRRPVPFALLLVNKRGITRLEFRFPRRTNSGRAGSGMVEIETQPCACRVSRIRRASDSCSAEAAPAFDRPTLSTPGRSDR